MIRGIRRQNEAGAAMMILITLMALMATYYVVRGLNQNSAEVAAERNQRTLQSMQEAKAALIAYAASQAWNPDSSQPENDQPGSLPCPGSDENQTTLIACDASSSTRIGWFPWKKVGTSKLQDSSGTALWYALSANFRKASGTTVINSDTVGDLQIYNDQYSTATPTQSAIVAVIIAPGPTVAGQNRFNNTTSDYLECRNKQLADAFSTSPPPAGAGSSCVHDSTTLSSDIFNDQLITITQADIMAVVEPAVAARIEQDMVKTNAFLPNIATYFSTWGRYPFPSAFSNPGTNTYVGDSTKTSGLLPISDTADYAPVSGTWTISMTGGTHGGYSGWSCTSVGSPSTAAKCSFDINAIDLGSSYFLSTTCRNPSTGTRYRYCIVNPAFTMNVNVSNLGASFADKPALSDVTVKNSSGSTNRTMTSTSLVIGPLQTDGSVAFTYSGTHTYSNYTNSNFSRSMAVTIPISTLALISTTDTAGWFFKNQWYHQLYYAVSPGYLPNSSALAASCSPSPATPTCLSLSGLSSNYSDPTKIQAILILGGYALNGSSRPSTQLSNYLEGNNATPGGTDGYSYTHISGNGRTLNDRVIVISP